MRSLWDHLLNIRGKSRGIWFVGFRWMP